jgi:hypothetical protein
VGPSKYVVYLAVGQTIQAHMSGRCLLVHVQRRMTSSCEEGDKDAVNKDVVAIDEALRRGCCWRGGGSGRRFFDTCVPPEDSLTDVHVGWGDECNEDRQRGWSNKNCVLSDLAAVFKWELRVRQNKQITRLGGFHPTLSLRRGENSNLGPDPYALCTATTSPQESSHG